MFVCTFLFFHLFLHSFIICKLSWLFVHVNMLIHSWKQNCHGSIISHIPLQIPWVWILNLKYFKFGVKIQMMTISHPSKIFVYGRNLQRAFLLSIIGYLFSENTLKFVLLAEMKYKKCASIELLSDSELLVES